METYFRYCPACDLRTKHDIDGQCSTCLWWERLHRLFGTLPLSRAQIIASYDPNEWIPEEHDEAVPA